MKPGAVKRLRLVSAVLILVAFVFVWRLYDIQVLKAQVYKDRADRQYVKPGQIIYDRGSIYFKDKDGEKIGAATLKTGFRLAINPRILDNPEDVYLKLNEIVPIDKNLFDARASKKDDPYEEITTRLTLEQGESINALKIGGVMVEKERWRLYPGERLGAHVLGFVGFAEGDKSISGRYGVERYYNDVLSRNDGNVYANFFAEIFLSIKKTIRTHKASGEGDIILTIEPTVQSEIAREVNSVKEKYNADEIGAIVMDPKNGAIFALVSLPDFDPNSFNQEKNARIFGNPLVENVYEMGSIIKPLTMAAGIDSKAVTPATTYDDRGYIILNTARIENFDGKGRGVVNMQEVLSQSLNTGVAFIASRVGNKKFADYMRSFGLGEETGIDLPGEIPGLIKNLESTRDIEYATASFGQGIALTPIATARALSTLANGGRLITPHVVDSIEYELGVSKKLSYNDETTVIAPESAEEVTRMLVKVVDEALAGGSVKIPSHSIAAKTGTAQIAKESGRGYYEDRYLHSFFGYFPAYEPRFLVFLYAYNPKGVRYASETWSEPFSRISRFLISYYNVPPDR